MKRKKWTREELRADRERREAGIAELKAHAERIKAELEAKRKTA